MRELIEQLRQTLELMTLAEGRQWRVVRRRIREDFRASRKSRARLSEFAGNGCPKGAHFNAKTKKCEHIAQDHELHAMTRAAHQASQQAHYRDGQPKIERHPHMRARSHHAKAAVAAYHHGFIDLANDHAKMASHHEKIVAKLKTPGALSARKDKLNVS